MKKYLAKEYLLPPGILRTQKAQAVLSLRMTGLCVSPFKKQHVAVRFKFWGEQIFSELNQLQPLVQYQVVTGVKLFQRYLSDMGPLNVQAFDIRNDRLLAVGTLSLSDILNYGTFKHQFRSTLISVGIQKKKQIGELIIQISYDIFNPSRQPQINPSNQSSKAEIQMLTGHKAKRSDPIKFEPFSIDEEPINSSFKPNVQKHKRMASDNQKFLDLDISPLSVNPNYVHPNISKANSLKQQNTIVQKRTHNLDLQFQKIRLERLAFEEEQQPTKITADFVLKTISFLDEKLAYLNVRVDVPAISSTLKSYSPITNSIYLNAVSVQNRFSFNQIIGIPLPVKLDQKQFSSMLDMAVTFYFNSKQGIQLGKHQMKLSQLMALKSQAFFQFTITLKPRKKGDTRRAKILISMNGIQQLSSQQETATKQPLAQIPKRQTDPATPKKPVQSALQNKQPQSINTQFYQLYARIDKFHIKSDFLSSYYTRVSIDGSNWLQSKTLHSRHPRFNFQILLPVAKGRPINFQVELWERGQSSRVIGFFKDLFKSIDVSSKSLYPTVIIDGQIQFSSDQFALYGVMCVAVGNPTQTNRMAMKFSQRKNNYQPTISSIPSQEGGMTQRSLQSRGKKRSTQNHQYIYTDQERMQAKASRQSSLNNSGELLKIYQLLNKNEREELSEGQRRNYLQLLLSPN